MRTKEGDEENNVDKGDEKKM